MTGPVMDPTEIMDTAAAVTSGLMPAGQAEPSMSIVPLNWPAEPSPLTARPTMNIWLDEAVAQMTRPASKMSIKAR